MTQPDPPKPEPDHQRPDANTTDTEDVWARKRAQLKAKRDHSDDRIKATWKKQQTRLKAKSDQFNDRIEEVWEKQLAQITEERDDYKAKRDAYLSDLQQVTIERDASLGDQQQLAYELAQLTAEHDDYKADYKAKRDAYLSDLQQVTAERDNHLRDLQRVTADFANFRRQTDKRKTEIEAQAASRLIQSLLPILDSFESAIGQGVEGIGAIQSQFLGVLEGAGLGVIGIPGEPFDPKRHEALEFQEPDNHEDASEETDQVVTDVLRTGYAWNSRVLRPALVRVRG